MNRQLRLLLVDDHQIMRDGLRAILADDPDIRVVGEACEGREALRLAIETRPDVVVMDVAMPDMNGIEATRSIRRALPEVKVVALSTHSDKRYVLNMLRAGASGYVLKNAAYRELLRAVHAAVDGGRYLSPEIASIVVDECFSETKQSGVFAALAPREREVLQLLAEGLTSRAIGKKLSIAVKTVETHRRHIMQKLELRTVAELTKYAVREGLTQLSD